MLEPPLFAVADGMGGAQAGEVASKLAAAALSDTDPGSLSGTERVTSLFQEANRRVYERSATDPAVSGMGTTMTVALVEGDDVVIGHVGDSRAYRLRGGAVRAAHGRPLARERADEEREAVAGGGRDASAARGDHARARHRPGRRRRRLRGARGGRRRVPDLLRRPDHDGGRRRHPRAARGESRRPAEGGEGAGRSCEPARRRGQHHRRRVPHRRAPHRSRRRSWQRRRRCRRWTTRSPCRRPRPRPRSTIPSPRPRACGSR